MIGKLRLIVCFIEIVITDELAGILAIRMTDHSTKGNKRRPWIYQKATITLRKSC
jgi:hypothetical protein